MGLPDPHDPQAILFVLQPISIGAFLQGDWAAFDLHSIVGGVLLMPTAIIAVVGLVLAVLSRSIWVGVACLSLPVLTTAQIAVAHPPARGARSVGRAAGRRCCGPGDLAADECFEARARGRSHLNNRFFAMSLSRRQLFGLSGGIVSGVGLTACGIALTSPGGSTGALLPSRASLPSPFAVDLPPLTRLAPRDGRADVTVRRRGMKTLPGRTTEIVGYDDTFPGPTIEATKGENLRLVVRNALDHPVVNHLHGGVTPAGHDGYPTDFVQPGSFRAYEYPLDQRAATLWYHDHTMDFTGPNVYAGMAGAFVLRDPGEEDLGLRGSSTPATPVASSAPSTRVGTSSRSAPTGACSPGRTVARRSPS